MSSIRKNILAVGLFLLSVVGASAQEGIGTNTPDKSAALEVNSSKRGLLIPRIELKAINISDPVDKPANSLLVYNTATSATTVSDTYKVTPGYYYWLKDENESTNSKWVRLITNSFYTAGEGMTLSSTEFSRNGLQELNHSDNSVRTATSAGDYGWRYIGLDQKNYAGIGKYATDLSYAPKDYDEFLDVHQLEIPDGVGGFVQQLPYSTVFSVANEDLKGFKNGMGAKGSYSFVSGLMNVGEKDFSNTLGFGNLNKAVGGVTLGVFNTADGVYSVVLGAQNKLEPQNMMSKNERLGEVYVIGTQNKVKAIRSVVLGSGNGNTEGGNEAPSEVIGLQSVTIGRSNGNMGENAVAIGTLNAVSGSFGVALGYGLSSKSQSSVAVGAYNTEDINPDPTNTTNKSKRVFTVGNGERDNTTSPATITRSDALNILRSGQMGIDIDNFETVYTTASGTGYGHIAGAKLQVNGLIQSRGILSADGTSAAKVVVADANGVLKTIDKSSLSGGGGASTNIYTADGTITNTRTVTFADDNSNITFTKAGTSNTKALLVVNGAVKASSFDLTSDERLKTISGIVQTQNFEHLNPVAYYWNEDGKKHGGNDQLQYGFLAQEIEKLYPHLVHTDSDGYKSVNYIQVIPILTKELQEERKINIQQQKQLDQQAREIEQLKKIVNQLVK